jgi:hypothetical protein
MDPAKEGDNLSLLFIQFNVESSIMWEFTSV